MCSNVSLMPTSMHFLHGSSLLLPIRLACDGSKLWLAARPTTALQLFWNRVSKKHACFSSAAEVLRNIVAFEVLWANKNYKKVIKCYKIFYFFLSFQFPDIHRSSVAASTVIFQIRNPAAKPIPLCHSWSNCRAMSAVAIYAMAPAPQSP